MAGRTAQFMRRVVLVHLAVIATASLGLSAETGDPVVDALQAGPRSDPEHMVHVDRLLVEYPEHPQILEIRYLRVQQLGMLDWTRDTGQQMIRELAVILENAAPGGEMAFRARWTTGRVYFHGFGDKASAYEHFKALEDHPVVHDGTTDGNVKRLELLYHLASSASGLGNTDEMEQYVSQILGYSLTGLEQPYRGRVYEYRDKAYQLYLAVHQRDQDKIRALEVDPRHPRVRQLRTQLLVRPPDPGHQLTVEAIEAALAEADTYELERQARNESIPGPSQDGDGHAPMTLSSGVHADQPSSSQTWSFGSTAVAWGIGAMVLATVVVVCLRFVRRTNAG